MNLTEEQIQLLCNLLKLIGKDSEMEEQIANALGENDVDFREKMDEIFDKLKEYTADK